ncbi:uncharacterized protein LOC135493106 [Lineus longissimus]|uniref:uncharacterized protein LOC135493106 n=1 Tax=Lineus longissimus TaxID=88925 RepID=UPI00315D2FE7
MVKMTVFMTVTASIDPKVISYIPGNLAKFLDKLETDTGATISFRSDDNIHFVKGNWEAVDRLRDLLEIFLCQRTAQRATEELLVTPLQIQNKNDFESGMSGERVGNSSKLSSTEYNVMDKDNVESKIPDEGDVIIDFRQKKLQPMKQAISSLKARLKNNPTSSSSVVTSPTEPSPPHEGVDTSPSKPSSVKNVDTVGEKVSNFSNSLCEDKLSLKTQEIWDLAQRVRNAAIKRLARRGKIPLRPRLLSSKTFEVFTGDVGSPYSWSSSSPAESVTSDIEEHQIITAQGYSGSDSSSSAVSKCQNRLYPDGVGMLHSFSIPDVPSNYLRPKQPVTTVSLPNHPVASSSFARFDDEGSESGSCIEDWPTSSAFGLNLSGKNSNGNYSEKSPVLKRSLSFPVQSWSKWDSQGNSQSTADTKEMVNLYGGNTAAVFSDKGALRFPMQPEGNLSYVPPALVGLKQIGHNKEKNLATAHANPLPVPTDLNLNANFLYQSLDALESEIGKPFKCDMCCYETNDCEDMRSHWKHCQVEGRYTCKVCSKCFKEEKDLYDHMKSHERSKSFSCHICSDVFTSSTSLNEHMKVHKIEKGGVKNAVTCSECDKTVSSAHKLQIHIKMFHQEQRSGFICQECGKSFSQKHSLVEHQNLHLGVRPFKCEVCYKDFSFKTSLRQHMMLHNTGKNYFCQTCGKGFMQKNSLKIHMAIHESKRSHVCSYCGKGFTQKQAMQRHERIHSGERPYACKICDKKFNDSSILRRHMNVHQVDDGQVDSSK